MSEISTQLLFFFSALGAFNGLVLGFFFFFFAKPKHPSHYFLGALLVALSIRVGKSVFYYFYFDLAGIYIQIGLFACWYIGPLLYFYMRKALEVGTTSPKSTRIHFTLLTAIALILFLVFPRSSYEEQWITTFIRIIYLQWIAYVLLSGYMLYKKWDVFTTPRKKLSFRFWVLSIYFGNAIVCLAFNTGNYTSYIVGALSFTFIFYLLVLLLLFAKKRAQLLLLNPPKYGKKRLDDEVSQKLSSRLQSLMSDEKLYLDPNIKLSALSKKMNVSSTQLSQLFNEVLQSNYNDYINGWRIEEAKRVIAEHPDFSLEAIGYDCGFNSKSTFYSAFKKHTGMTPSNYRDRL